ncbi:MAG: S9 family peptidase [Deltaproteobacteria bacterium]|nr:S9 family peptidase [Deltaproteobacteria bacterium]
MAKPRRALSPSPAVSTPPRRGGPPPTRAEAVVELLHGERVRDPYRWLEDDASKEVGAWTEAQNRYTRAVLDAIPGRKELGRALTRLLTVESIGTPVLRYPKEGPLFLFHTRRTGRQNQPILYVRRGAGGEDAVLVDPNGLSRDGTVALDWWYPSPHGRYLAYGTSTSGDELSTLRVREVATGKDLAESISRTPHTSLAWLPDESGFYYVRLPQPGSVPKGEEHYHRHVFFHRLGTDGKQDPVVFGPGRDLREMPSVSLSPNGRYLVVMVYLGWAQSEVHLLDRRHKDGAFVPVARGKNHLYLPEVLNDRLLLQTNEGASRNQVYRVDPARPARRQWKRVIAEREEILQSISVIGGKLVALYLKNAASVIALHELDGRRLGELPFTPFGTVSAVSGEWNKPDLYYSYSSYLVPPRILGTTVPRLAKGLVAARRAQRASTPEGAGTIWAQVKSPVSSDEFELSQHWYPSKDGTRVSMFLLHKKGLVRDGQNPTLLYGYGGFDISLTPRFVPELYELLRRGGVYAEANLRGGGEYGDAWHKGGMLGKKQNVFDDFIAAAEYLVAQKITRPEKLAIDGRSNGGLLTGAVLVQRPELFRVVVSGVPLLDMLRYHRYLIAKLWIPEYGTPEDPEHFKWLRAYSPYHNVKDGTRYPAVFIATGVSDSRVHPFHARKMAARLQAATGGRLPVLLRAETKAGHGAGKPTSKRIEEATDRLAFVLSQLGLMP